MVSNCLSIFLCVFVISGSLATIPGGLKPCKQSADDYNQCIATEIYRAIQFFKNGNEKLGVTPLEPYTFEKLVVDEGSGPVAITLEFKNVEFHGMTNNKILDAKNDWKTVSFTTMIYSIEILGDYTISGKVLVLPIQGTGKSNITMVDVEAKVTIKLKEVNSNGKHYIQAESVDLKIAPKKTTFDFQNLFNGDKLLGANMNAFLNENHDQIIKELNPAMSKGLSQKIGETINQILSKIPLKEVKV
ncbi:protein takeout [Halyomorpha halys]|uniref:protein takeout n=1 Tax=Halyomorpha halys TaxID=286706 RepID=UPI0006D4E421|nr:protein takeout-like [Halyomorpha halys]